MQSYWPVVSEETRPWNPRAGKALIVYREYKGGASSLTRPESVEKCTPPFTCFTISISFKKSRHVSRSAQVDRRGRNLYRPLRPDAIDRAEGLAEDGRIITCDNDPAAQKIARAAFDASPYADKIELKKGETLDTIRQLGAGIDFSFIDADKAMYSEYYEAILAKTRPGGAAPQWQRRPGPLLLLGSACGTGWRGRRRK